MTTGSPIAKTAARAGTIAALVLAMAGAAAEVKVQVQVVPAPSMLDRANQAFWWGDFDELERLYAVAKASTERITYDSTQLAGFRRGLYQVFNQGDANESYLQQLEALTKRWADERPQSTLAQAMYARALYARAWYIRGGAFADRVPPQAWADFKKHIDAAAKHLLASAATPDTTTCIYLMLIGRSAGWPADRLWAVAQDGLRMAPTEFEFYDEMQISLLPKWGGNARAVDALVEEAVERTRATRGLELYARLYSNVEWEYGTRLFVESRADWPKMRQGFRDALARSDSRYSLNRFARIACIAQDKQTLVELLDRIGDRPDMEGWGSGQAGRSTFETCKRWGRSA